MLLIANVRFGSKADIGLAAADVRFAPESGHGPAELGKGKNCPLDPQKRTSNGTQ
jgi:hypothetical protein